MSLLRTGEYLDWCLKQEKFAEKLYLRLSRHPDIPESARSAFIELAGQEQEHYNSLTFVKRILRASSELNDTFTLSADEIGVIEEYDRKMQHVSLDNLSFEKALELANELEAQFYEIHCLLERTTESKELKAVFKKLRTGDHEHFQTLSRLLESR